MNAKQLYDQVADEYIALLHDIMNAGRRDLLNAAFYALELNGSAESQLVALSDVRRELQNGPMVAFLAAVRKEPCGEDIAVIEAAFSVCPQCGEADSCCCNLSSEVEPGDELPV